MNTPPSLISSAYGKIDDALLRMATLFAPLDAKPARNTSTLLFLSSASGGAGFLSYGAHGNRIYEAAAVPWPPVPLTVDRHGVVEKLVTWSKMRESMDQIQYEAALQVIPAAALRAMQDETIPWYNISRITKYDRISDLDWSLFWAHTIGMDVPYATCRPVDDTWNHIHQCANCGGVAWSTTHDKVVSTILSASRRYGLVSSMDFLHTFGTAVHERHPDIVFYRADSDQKPLVVDVTIRHQTEHLTHGYKDCVRVGIYEKDRKYKDWFADDIEFTALLFTTRASLPKVSFDVLREVGRHGLSGFVPHVIRRIKCAIVEGVALRRRVLVSRFAGNMTPAAFQAYSASQPLGPYASRNAQPSVPTAAQDTDDIP